MNAVTIDIKEILTESSVGFIYGEDLFISREPTMPDNVVTLYDTSAGEVGLLLEQGEEMHDNNIQVRVRNLDYTAGMDVAMDIVHALHGVGTIFINGTYYAVTQCISGPAMIGRDEKDRVLITLNFNVKRR